MVYFIVPIAAILFMLFAPPNIKDHVIGVVSFASSERQCFNFHKEDFNDPYSAYIESSYVWSRKDENGSVGRDSVFGEYDAVLRIKARAKNKMGGYVSENIECPLIKGKFNKAAAVFHMHPD